MTTRKPRSRARSWALQILYAWDVSGAEGDLTAFASRTLARRSISERYRPYVEVLMETLSEHLPVIDATIRDHLSNWRLERITAIDRGILRLATAELVIKSDVPPKVAIHEAIRLAERYGTEESPRFVNGVLDAVARGVARPD